MGGKRQRKNLARARNFLDELEKTQPEKSKSGGERIKSSAISKTKAAAAESRHAERSGYGIRLERHKTP